MQSMLWCIIVLFVFIILSMIQTSCEEFVPLGYDLTIKCPSGAADFTSSPRKENAREFIYENTTYIIISDITHDDEGSYKCFYKDSMEHTTTIKIAKQSTVKEIVKFRSVGETLVLLFKCCTEKRQVRWTPLSGNSESITMMSSMLYISKHFEKRVKSADILHLTAWEISPVDFKDAGKYHLSDGGLNINLVTIQVKAIPSTDVYPGSSVELSCLVSHVLANMHTVLIWIKSTRYKSVHVKSQKVDFRSMASSIWIKNLTKEEITKWTCLVFNEDSLVALEPVTLRDLSISKSDGTVSIKAATTHGVTRNNYTAVTTGLINEEPTHGIITVYVIVGSLIIINLILIILLALKKLDTPGARNTEVQAIEALPVETQYVSVRFIKEQRGAKSTEVQTNESVAAEIHYSSVRLTRNEEDKNWPQVSTNSVAVTLEVS